MLPGRGLEEGPATSAGWTPAVVTLAPPPSSALCAPLVPHCSSQSAQAAFCCTTAKGLHFTNVSASPGADAVSGRRGLPNVALPMSRAFGFLPHTPSHGAPCPLAARGLAAACGGPGQHQAANAGAQRTPAASMAGLWAPTHGRGRRRLAVRRLLRPTPICSPSHALAYPPLSALQQ